jgi:hypothetical protein
MIFPPEIKAEVLINLLVRYGHNIHNFRFIFEGSFKRNYLEDVIKVEKANLSANRPAYLIYLNRDGFYDKLPEGMFHRLDRYVKFEQSVDQKTFKEEYEEQKNEIIHARKFFQAYENEFFIKNILRESGVFETIAHPFKVFYNFFFNNRNKLELNDDFTENVISFLPILMEIRGNISKLSFFLKSILQTNLFIRQLEGVDKETNTNALALTTLGKIRVGKNFYLGSTFWDHSMIWRIEIETQNEDLPNYIDNKHYHLFLKFVTTYLIPAGVKGKFVFKCDSPVDLVLGRSDQYNYPIYLGYNICI